MAKFECFFMLKDSTGICIDVFLYSAVFPGGGIDGLLQTLMHGTSRILSTQLLRPQHFDSFLQTDATVLTTTTVISLFLRVSGIHSIASDLENAAFLWMLTWHGILSTIQELKQKKMRYLEGFIFNSTFFIFSDILLVCEQCSPSQKSLMAPRTGKLVSSGTRNPPASKPFENRSRSPPSSPRPSVIPRHQNPDPVPPRSQRNSSRQTPTDSKPSHRSDVAPSKQTPAGPPSGPAAAVSKPSGGVRPPPPPAGGEPKGSDHPAPDPSAELAAAHRQIADLTAQTTRLQQERDGFAADLKTAQTERERLAAELKKSQTAQTTRLQQEWERFAADLKTAQTERERLTAELEKSQTAIKQVQVQCDEQTQELTLLVRQQKSLAERWGKRYREVAHQNSILTSGRDSFRSMLVTQMQLIRKANEDRFHRIRDLHTAEIRALVERYEGSLTTGSATA
jgi:predicted  nucleic acid-binding Zn-ribbon protein